MKKNHRDGQKFGGRHTTVTETAGRVADIVTNIPEVRNIVIGILDPRASGSAGQRVKIAEEGWGILLTVVGNGGAQQIRIFTSCVARAKLALARRLRDAEISISFR